MKVVKVFNALDFFTWSIKRSSRLMLTATLLLMVALVGLKNFEKETSVDSFIPPDHPSVLARQQVKDTFGLNDPIVIALDTGINDGIFEAEALNTIAQLEKMLWEIPAFRQDRISSILSEKSMSGDGFSLAVDDIG
jgi:predicted RND superfamily exporter protein